MSGLPTYISNTHLYLTTVGDDEAATILPQMNGSTYVPTIHHVAGRKDLDEMAFGVSRIYHIEIGDDRIGLHNDMHYPKLFYFDRKNNVIRARQPLHTLMIEEAAYLIFRREQSWKEYLWNLGSRRIEPDGVLKKMNAHIFKLLYHIPR